MSNPYPGLRSKHNQAAAIVDQLTLAEKAKLCSGKNFWHTEGIPRLNLPSVMVTDGPHGLRKQNAAADHVGLNKSVPSTCFPTACALAASWDTDLMEEVGVALGEQCVAEDVAVLLGPGLNIKRHPLCGRNFEYFSEDPLLSGKMAAALVRGVQSQGVGTSVKHFAVNNQEFARMYADVIVDPRTIREIYLRGFEIVVKEAQPWTVMCAYNRVNGTYCSEHDWLLNQVLRHEWGFEGLVVTDWGATNDRVAGVASGLDLEMPGSGGVNDELVRRAVKNKTLAEDALDQAVLRNVSLALLGQDVADKNQTLDHQAHHNLARRVAAESTVLLKNDPSLLPLPFGESVAVIGAFAKNPRYQGTGSSQVNPTRLDNAWQAIAEYSDSILYAPGYDPKSSELNESLIDDAVSAALEADTAIVFIGLPNIYESEGFDRIHMDLPEQHNRLVRAVSSANKNTIVVLENGAPVTMPWIDGVGSVIETYLSGQAGGAAVADVIFGTSNPSGKLAETFPWALNDVPSNRWFPGKNRQVHYREGLNVGYRYFDSANAPVLFPFGHGLSYTSFEFSDLDIVLDPSPDRTRVTLTCNLTNTGQIEGAEVVQVYVHDVESSVYRPEQELAAFEKVLLAPGETKCVSFTCDETAFNFYDTGVQAWVVEPGQFEIRVGASSRDIRLREILEIPAAGDLVDQESTQTAAVSTEAVRAMPGDSPNRGIAENEAEFERMLTRPVPAREYPRPFHINSSVGELQHSWLGERVRNFFVNQFLGSMGGSSSNATLNKMFEEMANHMPLRGLVLFSRGKVTHTHVRMIVAALNHQFGQVVRIWAQHKIDLKEK